MSKATKRKHVTKEILEDYYVPEDDEIIVKIVTGRGNNLHEVMTPKGEQYLVSMPTKFRRNVWVKRGDFVVVSPIKEGVKVQGEIVYILYAKQIKYLKSEKIWPEAFYEDSGKESTVQQAAKNGKNEGPARNVHNENLDESEESESDNDDDLFVNPNHRPIFRNDDESEESDSSEEEDFEESEDDQNGNSLRHHNDEKTFVDDEGESNVKEKMQTVKI